MRRCSSEMLVSGRILVAGVSRVRKSRPRRREAIFADRGAAGQLEIVILVQAKLNGYRILEES